MLFEQCAHVRPAAAELDEGLERVAAAAAAQDRVEEALRRGVVEHPAFLEGRESVRRQHLRPLVTVVTGSVAAGEDVSEAVREAVPLGHRHDGDFGAHLAQDLQHPAAALPGVFRVHAEVEQRELQLPHHLQPGMEAARGDEARLLLGRQRQAALEVAAMRCSTSGCQA